MKKSLLVILMSSLLAACGGGSTDKIGEADTVFNLLGKNDRIEIHAFDDPQVQGVTCYISYAKKGGLKETVNLEEDASDASVSCVQTAAQVSYNEADVLKPQQVFKKGSSLIFKTLQVMRYYDPNRKVFSYMIYSDRVIEGSPKNAMDAFSCYTGAPLNAAQSNVPTGKQVFGSCLVTVAQK
ncbi:CreA family protein [Neisseria montereyensis]|uniref:CreA family protein n=1 Tax=Neisseria montereyensis TaxID=2973938 RepID=A0ABT2FCL2_9NEIS|nr:CreA family protein [Neisseria montereyensis]MCS4533690.1 CreA family protein [Neisseria montereyensis]